MALEGPAAQWMVNLHNDNALELRNLNHFMPILCKWFEYPLANRKSRDHIKTILQGRRGVAEYTQEFCELACRLTSWPQDILINCFKDGLSDEIYNTCVSRVSPLHGWWRKWKLTWPGTNTDWDMGGESPSLRIRTLQNHW